MSFYKIDKVCEKLDVAPDLRKVLLGTGGTTLTHLRKTFQVTAHIPKRDDPTPTVSIEGLPENVSKAVAAIKTLLSEYVDRHYIVTKTVEVPKECRHVVIGSHGDRVANIKKIYNVRIMVP